MSEVVYGISAKGKGRKQVIAKDDLLIIEGSTGMIDAKSVRTISLSAANTIPNYDNGHNPNSDGFAAYSVVSVQQTIPNNTDHWTDCISIDKNIPYPKVIYNYFSLVVYVYNDSEYSTGEIKYRVVLLKVK